MTDLEGSEDLFWHKRVEGMGEGEGGGVERGGQRSIIYL